MEACKLAVEGALEFRASAFVDERGLFVTTFQEAVFAAARGGPLFTVAQTNHSVSRRGVIRGIHYTAVPPGAAKYVYCAAGEALDIVVDLRIGSPTFGCWQAVAMNRREFRAVYIPCGVGHAFIALRDETVISYMLSTSYVPEAERAISVFDPELGLSFPADIEPVMSERDSAAITLAEARERGLLPDYERCRELEGPTLG
ncbi:MULTISPECIES: dTDP-4-dehydrorhamnose 3,5-epimerase family protein [unclassified Streptomyces]|uniref:dTDP-4-dehydrorhamnose 3,5-epimerase family protein n=1 Tax=unclassified Streptomyces TaxID=2593676 RepID=UPI001F04DF90|nr:MULTISPECIES: dTDP-4-dehydrorhamnose 3,5-epimerase family protein [unclassified Streptomyces]MCH0566872.1 dTDP-4-dehydrorhamnose 3,5-epimerase family protein [Streptomyces sp. MUM 2J]MCH0569831.1 dTDP-4-dehydrorhamnose 3,5-epimerase family protein [Streptomyces sp. MUM 136J]